MLTNRFSKLVIVVVIAAVALLTISFTASPKANQAYQDYALRHPGPMIMAGNRAPDATQGSDWFQRHWAELGLSRSPDTTDYFFRHPELQVASRAVDLTDYYFRHSAR